MPWNHIEEKPKFLHKPTIFSQTKNLCPSKSDDFTKFLFSGNLLGFFTTRCQQHHLFLEGRKKTWTLYKGRSSMEGIEEFFLSYHFKVAFILIWNCFQIITFSLNYYYFFLSIFRNMVRNVKLGHGLFDLIKTEQAAKVSIYFFKESVILSDTITCTTIHLLWTIS